MHLKRWEEVEKRKQCVTCTWTQTDHEATECHLTNCTGSTLDPTKFNHWQLQNVLRIYVGRNFGWQRPNYKMSLGKIMLAIPTFSYFLTSDALDFVVLVLNYFPSQKELCSSFCSCKTRWSPRTRMLTRMLMVQMSKHMVMQSRTIPFCNSLFEQSCTCFPCYQSAVWSGKCRVWSVECEVRSVECKVWSGECRVCKV